ncbi:MAG: DJ-1/PfpI family protein [Nitrospinae bacterium]|jgi:protease I|nr:DJ-1/PfpI family protein [Nitrospinota bacterium]MDA1110845.1 DJ-1/PfpI family protein [Nitrospinota bacterium]
MARLTGKNILFIIPRDYYDEDELAPLMEIMKQEEARVLVASSKLKDAVGMKTGTIMPDVLIVDAMEGITGDSYVSGGRGTRQIIGVFHGVILIGGKGARSYLWKDELVRLLVADRYHNSMVVGAIGSAVPCLIPATLINDFDVAAGNDKHTLKELDKANIKLSENSVSAHERVITAANASAVKEFAEVFITEVMKTPKK